jgi:exodeoxyribonuclease VII small subunit
MPEKLDDLSFEDAMDRLEAIVSGMEGGHMPLEDMVRNYEEGSSLLKVCRARIETARQRVEVITANLDGNGKASLSEFDPATTAEIESSTTNKPRAASPVRRPATKPASSDNDEDIRLF